MCTSLRQTQDKTTHMSVSCYKHYSDTCITLHCTIQQTTRVAASEGTYPTVLVAAMVRKTRYLHRPCGRGMKSTYLQCSSAEVREAPTSTVLVAEVREAPTSTVLVAEVREAPTSTVLVAEVREAPDVAQPDAVSHTREDEVRLAGPLVARWRVIIAVVSFRVLDVTTQRYSFR